MISRLWTAFLLSLACASTLAWLVALMHEKNVRPVQDLVAFFKKQSKVGRIILGTFFIAMWVIASTKPGGGNGGGNGGGDGGTNNVQNVANVEVLPITSTNAQLEGSVQLENGNIGTGNNSTMATLNSDPSSVTDEWSDFTPITSTNTTRTLEGDDFRRGFVLSRVGTGEVFTFAAPAGANVCADWRAFGAAEDWIYESVKCKVESVKWRMENGEQGIDDKTMLRIHSDGWMEVKDGPVFSPFKTMLGIVPEANWQQILHFTPYTLHSQFWHFVTPSNTLQLTWQNVLLGRLTNTPVSVQMEVWPSGRFTYRYDLSRLDVEEVTNVLVGACLGGLEWATNSIPTNLTSLAFYPLLPEDAANGDRDGDGLSLLDELFAFGTDPDLRDTSGDGISDGEAVFQGLDPLLRHVPDADILARVASSATNEAFLAGNVVSTNVLAAWALLDGFAADWPPGATNVLWERSFDVERTSAWQQYFVSASPSNAAPWCLDGLLLEWAVDGETRGSLAVSPAGDSWRVPLAPDDFPTNITLRLRATGAGGVRCPTPFHLAAYAPDFRVDGGQVVTGRSGKRFFVFTEGSDSEMLLVVDHARRPHRAPPTADEGDLARLEDMEMVSGGLAFEGDVSGGTLSAWRPGIYGLPDVPLGIAGATGVSSGGNRSVRGGGGGSVVVLAPSAGWTCSGHGCGYDGLGYDWGDNGYYEEEYYPLDSKCLRKKWYHDWGGGWSHDGCEFWVSSGVGDDDGYVTTSADGGSGKVYVDGVEVWSGSAEHTYDDFGCGGGYHEDYLGDGCDSCDDDSDSDCADGNCDSLEGASLGSLKFRIPLGAPVKGQVAGFVWFSADGPTNVTKGTFQLLEHPDADVTDTTESGTRRIACFNSRGRDLRIEDIADGVQVTIYDTNAQTLEHKWRIENVNGDPAQVRLTKISRLDNVMSEETFTYSGGVWTRFDNVAGVGTTLTTYGDFFTYGDGVKGETRTTTDTNGATLSVVTTEQNRIGECDNAVMRETYRSESTGWNWKWSRADYWNDPQHSARHGQPRLVWGNARAWTYMDYDEFGHETLRVEQRGSASVPEAFPYVVSNVLYDASTLANAFVTVRDFEPLSGDSRHQDDAARPRTETRYVVTNGVATLVARTLTRYTRLTRDGYAAIKKETWRGGSTSSATDAYSYEITYASTGDGTPLLMRDAVAESLDENGILTVNAYTLTGNALTCTTRRYGPNHEPQTTNCEFPTYEVVERNASYGTVLRGTVRLTDGDAVIADEQSIYDDQNRLRSTTFLDGTSLTNAYSCCRLLWKRDREGRKVLRSARTGTDHLYYAMEDVWLGEVKSVKCKVENEGESVTNGFKVTKHYFDALGRETNTVVGIGYTPGEAASSTSTLHFTLYTLHSSYPYGGDDYFVSTDERGRVTVRHVDILADCIETDETVFTNGVEVVKTKSRSYFGGGSSIRREWPVGAQLAATAWTEERRFTDYDADGSRIDYVVTESSDCGVVTNSVSTYDLLGRLVTSAVSGANGSVITTSCTYEGATGRKLSEVTTGSPVVTYEYDDCGDLAATIQNGNSLRNATSYETVGGEAYRVVTSVRTTGTVTNSVQRRKQRLTGLSDALQARTVTEAASGRVTVDERSFDSATGLRTEVSQTEGGTPTTVVSMFGLPLEHTSLEGRREMSYDAFGRNAATVFSDCTSGVTNRIDRMEYDPSGNVVRKTSDFMDGRVAETFAEYDSLNRETRRTDALGNVAETSYDPLGRTAATGGDAYPLRFGYDTEGRKTRGWTTRDGGAAWDETQWEFDPASGLNTAKQYANGSRVAYAYTDNGKRTRTTWARGAWKQHAYNERNLVSGTTYSGTVTPSVAYAYADSGKMASAILSDGTSYAYGYDDRLLNTNESVTAAGEAFSVNRTFDEFRRAQETAVVVTNVQHSAKVRLYDSEDRVCGYALTNAAGRGVSVSLAYDGSYVTNTVYTLPNGSTFSARLSREAGRRNLVTRRDYLFGDQSIYWYSTEYDLLDRPTNATDSVSLVREWLYNRRSELAAATVGAGSYGYAYDSIGNRLWSAANAVTNSYTANSLNQYTAVSSGANPVYDADGNMTGDSTFAYAYDAENRLVSVTSAAETNGAIRVLNAYDHRNRRIRKTVQRLNSSIAPPPSPPVGIHEWETQETHTFVWDGNNIVLEKVEFANGTTRTFEYFWGADKSGSEQGAGGVEGLLAVSMDGVFYIPCYDHNGNIILYVSETGSIVTQYTYDPYGNIIESSGPLADVFSFGFSTQYHDRETGMVGYKRRFYRPDLGRWLNRDPIEEEGGENLYAFCENDAISKYDALGRNVTLTTGNRNASWWQVGNRFYHQEICVDTWSWNPKSCCWRKSGRSCYSFAATGFGFGGPGSDWLGMNSIKGPGILRGEVYPTDDQGLEDTETLETTPCQDRAFLDYLKSMDGREDTYSLGRHSCRTFSQTMMEEAKRRKNSGGCKNDKKCE